MFIKCMLTCCRLWKYNKNITVKQISVSKSTSELYEEVLMRSIFNLLIIMF